MVSMSNVKVISKCLGVYIGIPYMFTQRKEVLSERRRERGGGREMSNREDTGKTKKKIFFLVSSVSHFCFIFPPTPLP